MYANLLVGRHDLTGATRVVNSVGATNGLQSIAINFFGFSHRLDAVASRDFSSLRWYLSGGTNNTDPNLSIGGRISNQPVDFQSFTASSSLPGVTIVYGGNNAIGFAHLSYEKRGGAYLFRWVPEGSDTGFGTFVEGSGKVSLLTGDGSGTGFLVIDVDFNALASAGAASSVLVQNVPHNLFSDLTPEQAQTGYTSYRCLYLKNEHPTLTVSGINVEFLKSGNTGSITRAMADTAGAGDGVSTGVATTPASETSHPGGSFSDGSSPIQLPDLSPGQCAAVWLQREIYAGWYKELSPDVHLWIVSGTL